MALSGDIGQFPGIQFGITLFVNVLGEVSTEQTEYQVFGVSKVIDGSYEDVLQLIGYSRNEIEYLFVDDILRATDEVKTRLKHLPTRLPNCFVLEDNGRLYGVIIDRSGQTRVVGVVNRVVPGLHLDSYFKSVLIDKDDNWMFCTLGDLDIREKILSGALLGLISKEGFLFLQIKSSADQELSELVLFLSGGYYLIENATIHWIHPKSKEDHQVINSTIEPNNCLISKRGGCVRHHNQFEVFGIENSLISFETLQQIMFKTKQTNPGLEDLALNITRSESFGSHSSPKPIENHRNRPEKD